MLKPSQEKIFTEKYTSSLQDFLVSHSQSPAKDSAQKTPDTFGRILLESSRQLDLFGVSSRTSKITSILDTRQFMQAYEIWATMLRQNWLQHQMSARLTEGSDCLSWPTTTNRDWKGKREGNRRGFGADLNDAVNWRTPAADPAAIKTDKLTGEIGKRMYHKETGRLAQYGLEQQVNWPTTAAQNFAGGKASPETMNRNARPLQEVVISGQLAQDSPSTNGKSRELLWRTPTEAETHNRDYSEQVYLQNQVQWPTPYGMSANQGQGQGEFQMAATKYGKGKLNPAWVSSLQGIPAYWVKIIDFTDETPYTMVDLTERNNYETSYKILCLLSETIRTQAVQWEVGRFFYFLTQEILRQEMLCKGNAQGRCPKVSIAQTGQQISWEALRDLWHKETDRNPSPRRQHKEQRQEQSNDTMCDVPYEMALGTWKDCSENIKANLLYLRENMPYSCWDVSGSLPKAEEIWRSASDAETYQWFVATCQRLISWQESQQANRVDELRLLGNGVIPAQAEKAIRLLWQKIDTNNEK